MPPLADVIHAAMVLDDAIVANIDERRLLDVLRPKISGAENLDRLTLDLNLDYFVLFSSVTTVIGNPGQGAMSPRWISRRAGATATVHRAARARDRWAAIEDVGCWRAPQRLREAIAARAGVKGIKARTALDLRWNALAFEGDPPATASSLSRT